MTEVSITVCWARYIRGELNPDRVEKVYCRGKSRADCARLISEHTRGGRVTPHHLKTYGNRWGNMPRPAHEGRGVWITRDHFDRELIEVWTDNGNEQ